MAYVELIGGSTRTAQALAPEERAVTYDAILDKFSDFENVNESKIHTTLVNWSPDKQRWVRLGIYAGGKMYGDHVMPNIETVQLWGGPTDDIGGDKLLAELDLGAHEHGYITQLQDYSNTEAQPEVGPYVPTGMSTDPSYPWTVQRLDNAYQHILPGQRRRPGSAGFLQEDWHGYPRGTPVLVQGFSDGYTHYTFIMEDPSFKDIPKKIDELRAKADAWLAGKVAATTRTAAIDDAGLEFIKSWLRSESFVVTDHGDRGWTAAHPSNGNKVQYQAQIGKLIADQFLHGTLNHHVRSMSTKDPDKDIDDAMSLINQVVVGGARGELPVGLSREQQAALSRLHAAGIWRFRPAQVAEWDDKQLGDVMVWLDAYEGDQGTAGPRPEHAYARIRVGEPSVEEMAALMDHMEGEPFDIDDFELNQKVDALVEQFRAQVGDAVGKFLDQSAQGWSDDIVRRIVHYFDTSEGALHAYMTALGHGYGIADGLYSELRDSYEDEDIMVASAIAHQVADWTITPEAEHTAHEIEMLLMPTDFADDDEEAEDDDEGIAGLLRVSNVRAELWDDADPDADAVEMTVYATLHLSDGTTYDGHISVAAGVPEYLQSQPNIAPTVWAIDGTTDLPDSVTIDDMLQQNEVWRAALRTIGGARTAALDDETAQAILNEAHQYGPRSVTLEQVKALTPAQAAAWVRLLTLGYEYVTVEQAATWDGTVLDDIEVWLDRAEDTGDRITARPEQTSMRVKLEPFEGSQLLDSVARDRGLPPWTYSEAGTAEPNGPPELQAAIEAYARKAEQAIAGALQANYTPGEKSRGLVMLLVDDVQRAYQPAWAAYLETIGSNLTPLTQHLTWMTREHYGRIPDSQQFFRDVINDIRRALSGDPELHAAAMAVHEIADATVLGVESERQRQRIAVIRLYDQLRQWLQARGYSAKRNRTHWYLGTQQGAFEVALLGIDTDWYHTTVVRLSLRQPGRNQQMQQLDELRVDAGTTVNEATRFIETREPPRREASALEVELVPDEHEDDDLDGAPPSSVKNMEYTASKPEGEICDHCGARMFAKDIFGGEGRWFHRPCTSKGPLGKTAGKPSKCSHCGKDVSPSEIFGEEGRWLHRGCTKRGPMTAQADPPANFKDVAKVLLASDMTATMDDIVVAIDQLEDTGADITALREIVRHKDNERFTQRMVEVWMERLRKGHTAQVDLLPGGKADEMLDNAFDDQQLQEGVKHELEHTDDPALAREIARDHLAEDPKYYTKLRKIEAQVEQPKPDGGTPQAEAWLRHWLGGTQTANGFNVTDNNGTVILEYKRWPDGRTSLHLMPYSGTTITADPSTHTLQQLVEAIQRNLEWAYPHGEPEKAPNDARQKLLIALRDEVGMTDAAPQDIANLNDNQVEEALVWVDSMLDDSSHGTVTMPEFLAWPERAWRRAENVLEQRGYARVSRSFTPGSDLWERGGERTRPHYPLARIHLVQATRNAEGDWVVMGADVNSTWINRSIEAADIDMLVIARFIELLDEVEDYAFEFMDDDDDPDDEDDALVDEDLEEQTEPQDDDYIIWSARFGQYAVGRVNSSRMLGHFPTMGAAARAIEANMEQEGHYPAVWQEEERGGYQLLNTQELAQEDPEPEPEPDEDEDDDREARVAAGDEPTKGMTYVINGQPYEIVDVREEGAYLSHPWTPYGTDLFLARADWPMAWNEANDNSVDDATHQFVAQWLARSGFRQTTVLREDEGSVWHRARDGASVVHAPEKNKYYVYTEENRGQYSRTVDYGGVGVRPQHVVELIAKALKTDTPDLGSTDRQTLVTRLRTDTEVGGLVHDFTFEDAKNLVEDEHVNQAMVWADGGGKKGKMPPELEASVRFWKRLEAELQRRGYDQQGSYHWRADRAGMGTVDVSLTPEGGHFHISALDAGGDGRGWMNQSHRIDEGKIKYNKILEDLDDAEAMVFGGPIEDVDIDDVGVVTGWAVVYGDGALYEMGEGDWQGGYNFEPPLDDLGEWEAIELINVPQGIWDQTYNYANEHNSEAHYRDGYEAWQALLPYAGEVLYSGGQPEDTGDDDDTEASVQLSASTELDTMHHVAQELDLSTLPRAFLVTLSSTTYDDPEYQADGEWDVEIDAQHMYLDELMRLVEQNGPWWPANNGMDWSVSGEMQADGRTTDYNLRVVPAAEQGARLTRPQYELLGRLIMDRYVRRDLDEEIDELSERYREADEAAGGYADEPEWVTRILYRFMEWLAQLGFRYDKNSNQQSWCMSSATNDPVANVCAGYWNGDMLVEFSAVNRDDRDVVHTWRASDYAAHDEHGAYIGREQGWDDLVMFTRETMRAAHGEPEQGAGAVIWDQIQEAVPEGGYEEYDRTPGQAPMWWSTAWRVADHWVQLFAYANASGIPNVEYLELRRGSDTDPDAPKLAHYIRGRSEEATNAAIEWLTNTALPARESWLEAVPVQGKNYKLLKELRGYDHNTSDYVKLAPGTLVNVAQTRDNAMQGGLLVIWDGERHVDVMQHAFIMAVRGGKVAQIPEPEHEDARHFGPKLTERPGLSAPPLEPDPAETGDDMYRDIGDLESDPNVFEDAGDRMAQIEQMNVWVSPTGEEYASGHSHDRWARVRGTTVGELLSQGWVRVAPPDAVQVQDLGASRDLVQRIIQDLMERYPDRRGVWVETDEDNILVARTPTGRPDFSALDRQGGRTAQATRPRRDLDDHAVRELQLYVNNNLNPGQGERDLEKKIEAKLTKLMQNGKYDPGRAYKAWLPWINYGAQHYEREHMTPGEAANVFPKLEREEAARMIAREFEDRVAGPDVYAVRAKQYALQLGNDSHSLQVAIDAALAERDLTLHPDTLMRILSYWSAGRTAALSYEARGFVWDRLVDWIEADGRYDREREFPGGVAWSSGSGHAPYIAVVTNGERNPVFVEITGYRIWEADWYDDTQVEQAWQDLHVALDRASKREGLPLTKELVAQMETLLGQYDYRPVMVGIGSEWGKDFPEGGRALVRFMPDHGFMRMIGAGQVDRTMTFQNPQHPSTSGVMDVFTPHQAISLLKRFLDEVEQYEAADQRTAGAPDENTVFFDWLLSELARRGYVPKADDKSPGPGDLYVKVRPYQDGQYEAYVMLYGISGGDGRDRHHFADFELVRRHRGDWEQVEQTKISPYRRHQHVTYDQMVAGVAEILDRFDAAS